MRIWLRWTGYRVRSVGRYGGVGVFVSYGWLCNEHGNSDQDSRVSIFFIQGHGYVYKEI